MATRIVGVLNVTPDSFSDGGRFTSVEDAVAAGLAMVADGADWLDVGGESTRPGSVPVPEAEEIARVVPVIRELSKQLAATVRVSVDTYKAATAHAALAEGATAVNDVSGGLLDPEILGVTAAGGAAIVLGHLRGKPADMQASVHFDDVVDEVAHELASRVAAARTAGCSEVWADPGIGFGKHLDHNLGLLKHLARLRARLDVPIMVGTSRKRFVGDLLASWEPSKGSQPLRPPPATPSPLASPFGDFGTRTFPTTPARYARALALGLAMPSDDGAPPATRAHEARGGRGGLSGPEVPVGEAGGLPTRLGLGTSGYYCACGNGRGRHASLHRMNAVLDVRGGRHRGRHLFHHVPGDPP
jgi:dihydropteroate synthase